MKKLYRSRTDRMIAGVCGGIAKYFGIDSTIVRVITFLLIIPGGVSIWVYIALALIVPLEPEDMSKIEDNKFKSTDSDFDDIYESYKKEKESDEDFYW